MKFTKLIAILALLILTILAVIVASKTSQSLHYLAKDFVGIDLRAFYWQYILYFFGAMLCSMIMWKFKLNKKVILLIVFTLVSTSVLLWRNDFNWYHDHPEENDIVGLPACMLESNYSSFWHYLTEGCHTSIWDITRVMLYKSLFCIIIILITGYLLAKFKRVSQKHLDNGIID